jgi:MscS family membrane protein
MTAFEQFLNKTFLHNKTEQWLWFLGILFFGFLLKNISAKILGQFTYRLIKRETKGVSLAAFLGLLKRPVAFIISLTIISMALEEVVFSKKWRIIPLGKMPFTVFIERLLDAAFVVAVTWLLIAITRFIGLIWIEKAKETETKRDDQLVPFFRDLIVIGLCFISFFIILGFIFKQDVVGLITGLGIGGVALALAARETLENLFASFTIFFDRPFVVGDTVEVGNNQGDIENIGFRTTRLRTPDGSLLNVPNRLMVSQTVNNHTLREFRRIRFWLKLNNDTPLEKIESLVESIKEVLALNEFTNDAEQRPYVQFDNFGEYALEILVVYFVMKPDFREFKAIQAEVNLAILEEINRLNIKLAVPLSEVALRKE